MRRETWRNGRHRESSAREATGGERRAREIRVDAKTILGKGGATTTTVARRRAWRVGSRPLRGAEWSWPHATGRRRRLGGWTSVRGVAALWQQIVKTKPESQWIVTTRPLYHLQQPVSYSSRLQVIYRAGSGICDRSRLIRYECAWLPPHGR